MKSQSKLKYLTENIRTLQEKYRNTTGILLKHCQTNIYKLSINDREIQITFFMNAYRLLLCQVESQTDSYGEHVGLGPSVGA